MKKGIHPEEYRLVAFRDMSNGHTFITKSTVATRETAEVDGTEYPLYKRNFKHRIRLYRKVKLVDSRTRGQVYEPLRKAHGKQKEIRDLAYMMKAQDRSFYVKVLFCRFYIKTGELVSYFRRLRHWHDY